METNKTQQESKIKTEPQNEHHWLQKFVGEWTYETEMTMKPDISPEKFRGRESVRSLGEWILAEGQGEMPECGAATTMMTLGYDPQNKRYVGTWIGSMMTHLWIYDGELDESQKVLTLNSEGPAMTGKGMAKYRDAIEFKSDDLRVLTSYVLEDDGKWYKFMKAHYRRQK